MKLGEMNCLYIGTDENTDSKILIVAMNEQDAQDAADQYAGSNTYNFSIDAISNHSDKINDIQFALDHPIIADRRDLDAYERSAGIHRCASCNRLIDKNSYTTCKYCNNT